ncbi:hypothetical protein IE53DRAFT_389938 [Violaceomyces palustris]|uniref:Uncharacterized protein n=1 Tax=Violaceomyces palustris TaxID=1673888 RepID=A0ACD0NQ14_9BASI|nr:hypothetical protein IE53DRAFT_389938 [Violaceomyces palustris]
MDRHELVTPPSFSPLSLRLASVREGNVIRSDTSFLPLLSCLPPSFLPFPERRPWTTPSPLVVRRRARFSIDGILIDSFIRSFVRSFVRVGIVAAQPISTSCLHSFRHLSSPRLALALSIECRNGGFSKSIWMKDRWEEPSFPTEGARGPSVGLDQEGKEPERS